MDRRTSGPAIGAFTVIRQGFPLKSLWFRLNVSYRCLGRKAFRTVPLVSGNVTSVGEGNVLIPDPRSENFQRDDRLHRSHVHRSLKGTRYVGNLGVALKNEILQYVIQSMFLFRARSHLFQDLSLCFYCN